ncbi:MAG: hypothetical protein JJ895_01205 [Balneolaceae bacterium]|nr:hypothetical protein [Balneolaceae bacterium]
MKLLTCILLIVGCTMQATAQDVDENISFEIKSSEFSKNHKIIVKNINGELNVTGYSGDEIRVKARRQVWKERGRLSQNEADEVQLTYMIEDGFVFVYVDAPGVNIDFDEGRIGYNMNWDDDNYPRFNFDIDVQIPEAYHIEVATVNGGDVFVQKMNNQIKASNINGDVKVKDAKTTTDARTVNGDIEVWFDENPIADMDFSSVNGTIEIYSPKDFGAVVTFESLHGELYTDFKDVQRLPHHLNRATQKQGNRYKISTSSPIQIGDGGPSMSFKLVNGSVYIRERKS